VTPKTLELFDQAKNREAEELNGAQTPFGLYLGVDFETRKVVEILDEPYWSQLQAGTLTRERAEELRRTSLNVVREYQMTLRVRKL